MTDANTEPQKVAIPLLAVIWQRRAGSMRTWSRNTITTPTTASATRRGTRQRMRPSRTTTGRTFTSWADGLILLALDEPQKCMVLALAVTAMTPLVLMVAPAHSSSASRSKEGQAWQRISRATQMASR